jgi:hypothetical protein
MTPPTTVNLNWIGIRTLQMLGLVWDVKQARVSERLAASRCRS